MLELGSWIFGNSGRPQQGGTLAGTLAAVRLVGAPRWECWRRRPAAPRAAATRAPRGAMSLVASCACSSCSSCCSAALKVLQCSACSNGRFPHFVPRDRTAISPVIARQTRRPFALFPFRIPSPRRARRAAGLMSTSLLSSAVR